MLLTDKQTTEILYGGGAGGGKSYLGCIWHIYNRLSYPLSRGLIGRAKISALEQSTLVTLRKVARLMGYQEGVHFKYNSQKHVITWGNGSETILKDLFLYPSDPDFISLGSTEYTDAFIDEANEITEKAFDIVNSRIRWMLHDYGLVPKILMTANPGPGWLKEKYVLDKDGNEVILEPYQKFVRALVTDNPDKAFTDLYRQQLERMASDYDKSRLLFGEWDAEPSNNSPFAYQFDPLYHVSPKAVFIPSKPIIISIDFNLQPFAVTFSHFWQDQEGVHDWTFDEAEIQQGSIPAMIELIKSRYGKYLFSAEITGDFMGRRGDLSQRDNASLYTQLVRGLGIPERQVKLPKEGNPTHENSKADTNFVLWKSKQKGSKAEFIINPSCKGVIRDFKIVQWDDMKGCIKKRDRSDVAQRSDYCDCQRYRINIYWRDYIKRTR